MSSLFSHSLMYLLVRGANGLIGLAALALLVRLLPAEQYGQYALAAAVCNSGAALLFQWISVGVSRFHAGFDGDAAPLMRMAHRLYAAVAGAVVLATAVAALLPLPWPTALTVAVGTALVAMALYNLHSQIANARSEPLRYGALSVLRAGIALALAVALIHLGLGPTGAVVGLAVGAFAAVAVAGARWSAGAAPVAAQDRRELRQRLISYGTPLALAAAATMVVDVSDRFLIGWLRGPAEVAPYAAAYDLTQQSVGMLLNVLFLAAYPQVTRAWQQGGAAAARTAIDPIARTFVLLTPLVLLLSAGFAPAVCRLMFGAGFPGEAAQVMPWVALAVCLAGWRSFVLDIAFQLAGRTGTVLRITLAMAALNIAANLLLIPRFGAVGAAIAATLAFAFGAACSLWASRDIGVQPRVARPLAGAAVCAAVAALPLLLVNDANGSAARAAATATGVLLLYAACAWSIDLCGLRSWLQQRLRPRAHTA